ncbi:MAG: hypothetical protein ACOX15_08990 [Tepidanaerobacteraceae bacterium]
MKGKTPTRGLSLGGVFLLLLIVYLLVTKTYPIDFSQNALSKVQNPVFESEIIGDMSWDGGDGLYLLDSTEEIQSVDFSGNVLWRKNLDGRHLVWMGPGGFLTYRENRMELWDRDGNLLLEKSKFIETPQVLSAEGDFLLISGKIEQKDCTALLSKDGSVIWILAWDGRVVSGSNMGSGMYTVLNLIEEDVTGRMVLIDSLGQVALEKKYPDLVLCCKVVNQGITAITEENVFTIDFFGNEKWSLSLEQKDIYRADIGKSGCIALVVTHKASALSDKDRFEILMLSPEGQTLWSYILEDSPRFVTIEGDFVYIIDDNGMTVLSKQGLLQCNVRQKGISRIEVIDSKRLIIKYGVNSGLLNLS